MKFHEQMNVIIYGFHSMKFVTLLQANTVEDQLTILFNSLTIEYIVSILWHQHEMVSDLTIAMAKTVQFQRVSHPSHRWLATSVATVPKTSLFYKKKGVR